MTNNSYAYWDRLRGKIVSNKGGWVIGEAVYNHGYDMINELVGKKSYFQILLLNITGRLPEENLAKWIEVKFSCMSWPDARIWCNQVSALAGAMRASPMAATCAGVLASDARMYGPGAYTAIGVFIQSALIDYHHGMSVEEIINKELALKAKYSNNPVVIGYSRPIARGDERVKRLREVATAVSLVKGEHEQLSEKIHQYVLEHHNEGVNVGGYCVPVLLDHGYSLEEIYRIMSMMVFAGTQACYAEAYDKAKEGFLPLRCEDIDYIGIKKRKLKK